jgi:hypothetical protein
MKKILTLICLCIPIYSFSQIERPITKGNSIISGGGTFKYSQYSSNLIFNPGYGYFVVDNLALGLNTTFSYTKVIQKSFIYGIGPFAKYYFNNGLFLKTETFFTKGNFIGYVNSYKTTNFSIIQGIGYSLFLNSKISLEPSLNYNYIYTKAGEFSTTNTNDFLFELKLNIFL